MIWKRKKKEKYVKASNNKTLIAHALNINRKRIYHHSKLNQKDNKIRNEINKTHINHPAYGHKRLAIHLGIGKNRALRVMKKYNIKPPRRKIKRGWTTVSTNNHSYTNLIKNIVPKKPAQIFVSDLTCIKYHGKKYYLATVEDIYTREILSAQLSTKHDSTLALFVIKSAISNNSPQFFHLDQGTEFMSHRVTSFLEKHKVQISVSDVASPWQNGYKESFFSRFKEENGDLNRFETLGELVEEIYAYVYYHNNLRIHTALKMSPVALSGRLRSTIKFLAV